MRLEGKLGQLVECMQARRHEELPSPPEQAVAAVVDDDVDKGEQKSLPYTMEEIVIINFLKPLPIHLPTNKVCIYIWSINILPKFCYGFWYIYLIILYEIVCFHYVFRFCVDLVGMVKIMQKICKNGAKSSKLPKPCNQADHA